MKKYLFICLIAMVAVSTLSSFRGKSREIQNAMVSVSYFEVPGTPSLTILGYNGKGVTLVSASGDSNTTSYNWYLNGVFLYTTTINRTGIQINCGSYGLIGVEAVNASGVSPRKTQGVVGCELSGN